MSNRDLTATGDLQNVGSVSYVNAGESLKRKNNDLGCRTDKKPRLLIDYDSVSDSSETEEGEIESSDSDEPSTPSASNPPYSQHSDGVDTVLTDGPKPEEPAPLKNSIPSAEQEVAVPPSDDAKTHNDTAEKEQAEFYDDVKTAESVSCEVDIPGNTETEVNLGTTEGSSQSTDSTEGFIQESNEVSSQGSNGILSQESNEALRQTDISSKASEIIESDESDYDDFADDLLESNLNTVGEQPAGNEVTERRKLVLVEQATEPHDPLPEGWLRIAHDSGMPLYLHRDSRVVTAARPYFIGSSSSRKHDVPLSAIPCLFYRRAKDYNQAHPVCKSAASAKFGRDMDNLVNADKSRAVTTTEVTSQNGATTEVTSQNGLSTEVALNQEIVTSKEATSTVGTQRYNEDGDTSQTSAVTGDPAPEQADGDAWNPDLSLNEDDILAYCRTLFEFKQITIKKFRTWKERRECFRPVHKKRPIFPSSKIVTCPLQNDRDGKKKDNAATPYSATVQIKDVTYGTGLATSKKLAKLEAARQTLMMVEPKLVKKSSKDSGCNAENLLFFDQIRIEDPRIYELCSKVGQPAPYVILVECLQRNFGLGDTEIHLDMNPLKNQGQRSEFVMKVAKHEATVVCKNKKEGKQRAAQSILQKLHPQLQNWGSLARMYGSTQRELKIKREQEQSITELQTLARSNRHNQAILDKLKENMMVVGQNRDILSSQLKCVARLDQSTAAPKAVTLVDL